MDPDKVKILPAITWEGYSEHSGPDLLIFEDNLFATSAEIWSVMLFPKPEDSAKRKKAWAFHYIQMMSWYYNKQEHADTILGVENSLLQSSSGCDDSIYSKSRWEERKILGTVIGEYSHLVETEGISSFGKAYRNTLGYFNKSKPTVHDYRRNYGNASHLYEAMQYVFGELDSEFNIIEQIKSEDQLAEVWHMVFAESWTILRLVYFAERIRKNSIEPHDPKSDTPPLDPATAWRIPENSPIIPVIQELFESDL